MEAATVAVEAATDLVEAVPRSALVLSGHAPPAAVVPEVTAGSGRRSRRREPLRSASVPAAVPAY